MIGRGGSQAILLPNSTRLVRPLVRVGACLPYSSLYLELFQALMLTAFELLARPAPAIWILYLRSFRSDSPTPQ
jgi:hypothetical protein